MEKIPLVSIITPCFNGETFIHSLFDSILRQTYTNIEFIFVDDGSTDKTEEIARSYATLFQDKGIDFIYIYQENGGQASAINQGLKIFRGKYLMTVDSDDWLTDNSVSAKVSYLESHPNKMFVTAKAAMVYENSDKIERFLQRNRVGSGWLFEDLLFERDVYYCGYMFRADAFLKTHPQKVIYESRGGQNWQLLLPMAYCYECGFLDEVLYYVLIRPESHSREIQSDYQKQLDRIDTHQDLLEHIIQDMDMPEEQKQKYLARVKRKYIWKRLQTADKVGDHELMKKQFSILLDEKFVDLK